MMKFHVLSDLHLEFATFDPFQTDADVVVLAGDIGKGVNGIYWARAAFPDKEIVYVPGNHEFYGLQRGETLAAMRLAAQENDIHLLDNDSVVIGSSDERDRVRILGCTLWTDFALFGPDMKVQAMQTGHDKLNDFRLIREDASRFSPARSVELHEHSLAWLIGILDTPFDGKTVVITHHLPSAQSVVERYKFNLLSACFASELDYLFGKMNLWVHGHTHENLDYESRGTRVICNPRGYVSYGGAENFDFNPRLLVEI
jgi:predicted phosphodiesterase